MTQVTSQALHKLGKERLKRWVIRRLQKTCNDGADVM